MLTVLLTGGRVAFSLALARRFHAAGARVLVADSWPRTLCTYSSAVERYFSVPSPALKPAEWFDAIAGIADEFKVDLIVPVFEETLYLAEALERHPSPAKVFASDFATLHMSHNKWLFNQKAAELGLAVPHTTLLTSRDDLVSAFSADGGRNKIYKRVYSRFASHKITLPETLDDLASVEPTPEHPWVAQDFITGRPISTFGLAHQGRLTAHACYAADLSLGFGPTVAYRKLDQPAAYHWVRTFVEATNYTGQIGVDFIEDSQENISAIECNPRLTGGMFLLKDDPAFVEAYIDPDTDTIFPDARRMYTFRRPLLLTLLLQKEYFPGVKEWTRVFFRARSANPFTWSDPLPRLMERPLQFAFMYRCLKNRVDVRNAATADFEWSHTPQPSPASDVMEAPPVSLPR